MLLTLLLACPIPVVVIGDPADGGPGDTDSGDGEDTAEETGSDPHTDLSGYTGTRRFKADYGEYHCDDAVTDNGTELTSGEVYSYLGDVCPDCDRFYQNDPYPTVLCGGYLMVGTAWRAMKLDDDGTAAIEFILGYDTYYYVSTKDEEADWNGRDLEFAYTLDLGGIEYDTVGSMSFTLGED